MIVNSANSGVHTLSLWSAGAADQLLCSVLLQAIGQKTCSSSQTQILLASDPLWATLFSGVLGSGEQALGGYGLSGGGAIVGGAVVAGIGSARREQHKRRNT